MFRISAKIKIAVVSFVALSGPALAELEPFTEGQFASYVPDAARGEVIYSASGCATCHSAEGTMMLLSGGRVFENKLGKVYAPNITHDDVAGIGAWTDAQFLNALMRGVSPEGEEYYGAFFPFQAYARMKPEDALDLRAFLRTLEKSDAPSRPHETNVFSRSALLLFNTARATLTPPADLQLARGQYLTEALGHCGECHTPRSGFEMDRANAFKGFMGFFGDYSPDISANRLKSVAPEVFITGTMRDGKKLNGRSLGAASMRRIVSQTASLPIEDRAAIYAYLTGTPVDVSALPPEPVRVAQAATGSAAVATDAAVTTAEAQTPAAPVAAVIDAEAIGATTGSVGLMKIIAAACEPPVAAPTLTAVPAQTQAAVVPVAAPMVPEAIEVAADRIMDSACRTCHGPGQRNDRTFPMHDITDIAADRSAVVPGDPEKSPLYASIALNRMPMGTKLTPDELGALKTWIMALGDVEKAKAAAPATATAVAPQQVAQSRTVAVTLPRPEVDIPDFVGGDFTGLMMAAVADLQSTRERDRSYMRYFSFADTRLSEVDCTQEGARLNPMTYLHAGLNKFINSVSRSSTLMTVSPVAGTDGALVRIDLRDYGWSAEDWDALSTGIFTQGAAEAGFSQQSWEDLARVFPFAIDPNSDSLLAVLANGTGAPVPIIGASWFTHVASEAPYYDMLLRLPAHIRDLEARMGVDVDTNIRRGEVVRAGFAEGSSGVSDHNRMIERHDLQRGGYYWKSYDFAGSSGTQSLLLHPDGPAELDTLSSYTEPFEHDGGEMIFSLANGMQGYYLSTAQGERLLVGPTSIVSYRNKPIGKGVEIENARSCFDCHENAIISKTDELRKFIESSNRFDRDQRDAMLGMYVPADEMQDYFAKDASAFLSAMSQLGLTEPSASGMSVSLRGPGPAGGEIMTYLSDLQFENLDLNEVARLFFLTEDEFRGRIRSIGDPTLMQIAEQWVQRIDDGLHVRRSEIEDVWADLLPRLTDLRPYRPAYGYGTAYQPTAVVDYEATAAYAAEYSAKQDAAPYVPQPEAALPVYAPPQKAYDPLVLELSVPVVNVYVNDLLEFDVRANRRCELQVLYVEETKTVEELPPEVIGPAFLEPGELRRIPYPGSGFRLRFDTPGKGETMLAYCREGGLGDTRLTGQGAMDYAREHFQPLSRGLIIERTEQVAEDNGQSATNSVTFNVSP
ncbi:MAG: c-type cytochrome [Rhodobacteraceae bacterium]|nr:c-type cytochrome [Paracoccaceae bacterium]MCF8513965.1 c-type cytochrome [Paracoccaceae bacterium]MCF8518209.1 c-type cytochrome [Paracoccaceae bacterium]